MAKDSSVAPKERINIKYVPATSGQQEEKELPLRMMVIGDFHGREDSTSIEERKILSVDKTTFATVMEEANIEMDFTVPNTLNDDKESELKINLKAQSLKDFEPDSVAKQVPELNKLLELREALTALKGPLGNMPAFRRNLQSIISDKDSREKLLKELQALEGSDALSSSKKDK